MSVRVMPKLAKTVDDFLVRLEPDKRAALQRLRRELRAILPDAEECMSYGVPGLRVNDKLAISFGAGKEHCALYPGAAPIERYARELAHYETSRGTIRFAADAPLPKGLLRKIVKAAALRTQAQKPPRLNAHWHQKHRMPKRATLEQRVAWHRAHAKHCACRPVPVKLRALLG